jgi:uncharacterized protein YndB with AHSA1/START domain
MQKIHFSILINAPKEKVWDTMLGDVTYREWTKSFNPGSRFVGDWSEGSKILFVGPAQDGQGEDGMVSRIKENRQHEFVSIEHLGLVKNGVEDMSSEEAKKWAPSFENYTFTEKDGGTEVEVDMSIDDEYKTMFEEMWPKALEALKDLAEKQE